MVVSTIFLGLVSFIIAGMARCGQGLSYTYGEHARERRDAIICRVMLGVGFLLLVASSKWPSFTVPWP
jgi:hypothetical protein